MNRPTEGVRRPQRRDRLIREREHDPYKAREKHPEPTVCPDCQAVYRDGRWQWVDGPFGVPRTLCPACQRIRDGYPAGYVTLRGEFLGEHRVEILSLARNLEERERVDHPLKRIMEIREEEDALVITTTDMHLARLVGESIHRAYQGEIDYRYSKEGSVLRVGWIR
jgi:NMD protein affecting ribosome stability and mRNA decay